jgi:hypothetical protein
MTRDQQRWPGVAQFRVQLPTIMKNINSVAVVSAQLPNAQLTVDTHNSLLSLREDEGSVVSVTLTHANYAEGDAATLALDVHTQIATAPTLSNTYSVTETGGVLTIARTAGTAEFELLLGAEVDAGGQVAALLGFAPGVSVPSDVSGEVTGTSAVAVGARAVCVDVHVEEFETTFADHAIIARIPMDSSRAVTTYSPAHVRARTFFPVDRLSDVTLSLRLGPTSRETVIPYNFHGQDVTLTLEFGLAHYENRLQEDVVLAGGTI